MVPTNSLDPVSFVCGNLKLEAQELTTEQRINITMAALEASRPYCKYFPDMRPLGEFFSRKVSPNEYRLNNPKDTPLPAGATYEMRCMQLLQLKNELEEVRVGCIHPIRDLHEEFLFFTMHGNLLLWKVYSKKFPAYAPHADVQIVGQTSELVWADEEMLHSIFSHPAASNRMGEILLLLDEGSIQKLIDKHEERLSNVRRLKRTFEAMRRKLRFKDSMLNLVRD